MDSTDLLLALPAALARLRALRRRRLLRHPVDVRGQQACARFNWASWPRVSLGQILSVFETFTAMIPVIEEEVKGVNLEPSRRAETFPLSSLLP